MEIDKSNEREIQHKRPPSPNHSVKSSLTANNAYVKRRKRSSSSDSGRSCGIIRDKQLDQKHGKNKHVNDHDHKNKHKHMQSNRRDSPSNSNSRHNRDRQSKSPAKNRPDVQYQSSANKIPIDEKERKRKLFEEYQRKSNNGQTMRLGQNSSM